jgi:hypothetical protein
MLESCSKKYFGVDSKFFSSEMSFDYLEFTLIIFARRIGVAIRRLADGYRGSPWRSSSTEPTHSLVPPASGGTRPKK